MKMGPGFFGQTPMSAFGGKADLDHSPTALETIPDWPVPEA